MFDTKLALGGYELFGAMLKRISFIQATTASRSRDVWRFERDLIAYRVAKVTPWYSRKNVR